eukprot:scaffold321_cov95-Cylindrotheca_fusiformis.AAC.2
MMNRSPNLLKHRGSKDTTSVEHADALSSLPPSPAAASKRQAERLRIVLHLKTYHGVFLSILLVSLVFSLPVFDMVDFLASVQRIVAEEDNIALDSSAFGPSFGSDTDMPSVTSENDIPSVRSDTDIPSGRSDTTTSSFCLLTKDDGEILNEWIAYHYHVMNMRDLIIAVDPSSTTIPMSSTLMERWKTLFGINIEVWNDEDFMPDDFLRGDYSNQISYLKDFKIPGGIDNTTKEYEEQLRLVNNHRDRQHTFVSHCMRTVKDRHSDESRDGVWVAHVDSDEYISLNPKVVENIREMKPVVVPQVPTAGSLLKYMNDVFLHFPSTLLRRRCLLMPRILYIPQTHKNETKNNVINTKYWNTNRFETLRWEVHRDLSEPTGFQKAIMDVAAIDEDHQIFTDGRIYDVHQPLQPSPDDCASRTVEPDLDVLKQYPLVVNHYFGSLERYLHRNDIRRHESIWRKKAELNGTLSDGWILGWLPSFVKLHGLKKVSKVLRDYRNTSSKHNNTKVLRDHRNTSNKHNNTS